MKSAIASAKVSASVTESGGWGTLSPSDKVSGWGRSGEQQQNYGWGTGASGKEQKSGNSGTLASNDNVVVLKLQDVPMEGAHYESSACSVVPSAGAENKVGDQAQNVNSWGSTGDDASNSSDCSGTLVS